MKTIDLIFKGYWLEKNKACLPSHSGVYCVYSCNYNLATDKVRIDELYYIGESENVCNRNSNHERLEDWKRRLKTGQTLCYSVALVSSEDRERAEAALIIKTQPPFNSEHTGQFIYNDTIINTRGKNKYLPAVAVVRNGETR